MPQSAPLILMDLAGKTQVSRAVLCSVFTPRALDQGLVVSTYFFPIILALCLACHKPVVYTDRGEREKEKKQRKRKMHEGVCGD